MIRMAEDVLTEEESALVSAVLIHMEGEYARAYGRPDLALVLANAIEKLWPGIEYER